MTMRFPVAFQNKRNHLLIYPNAPTKQNMNIPVVSSMINGSFTEVQQVLRKYVHACDKILSLTQIHDL